MSIQCSVIDYDFARRCSGSPGTTPQAPSRCAEQSLCSTMATILLHIYLWVYSGGRCAVYVSYTQ